MTYSESAQGEMITKKRAFVELRNHGCEEYDAFMSDVKADTNGMYDAGAVLEWLGY